MRVTSERLAPGQNLGARHVDALHDFGAASALTPSAGNRTTRGTYLTPLTVIGRRAAAGETVKRQFDLTDKAATSFSVLSNTGRTYGVAILGIWRTVGDGAGMTWDAATKWTSGVIAEATYVYIKLDREAPTAPTIIAGATLPDGTDTVEYVPLWYLPFADGAITWADAVDMRAAIRLPGMA